MRFTQPGPYFLALLLALSIPTLGCGRGAEEEQDQVSIEQEDGTFDSGDQTAAKDPEVPTRRIEVAEPETGDDIGADPVLDERERRLAERQAELDARERRLRELKQQEEPSREARVAERPAPKPEPREPKVAAPEPREREERQARAPRPAPPVERPARKPVERPAEPEETEVAEVEDAEARRERETARQREAENERAERDAREARDAETDRAEREREREERALREEREARRREEERAERTEREERSEPSERSERSETETPRTASVPAGTVMEAQFLEGVSSESSEPGDIFRARIANDVTTGRGVAIPAGSEVIGVVTEAVPTRKVGGRARLAVKFTDLVLPSGGTVPIRASFVEEGRSQTGKDAATIGGAAAGGAVLGRILNRKDRSKGGVIGAIIGAAAGTILASRTPGEEVSITEGTVVNLKLDDGIEIRRRR